MSVTLNPLALTTIGSFTALSSASGDYLAIDPALCSGFVDAPSRNTVEAKPDADGADVYAPLDDAQVITLGGALYINSGNNFWTLLASLKSALNGMKSSHGTLTDGTTSCNVRKYSDLTLTWDGITTATVQFSLVVDA